jgi:hypothetical protein
MNKKLVKERLFNLCGLVARHPQPLYGYLANLECRETVPFEETCGEDRLSTDAAIIGLRTSKICIADYCLRQGMKDGYSSWIKYRLCCRLHMT